MGFLDEDRAQPGFPNINPMMAMMMFNNMKMMMAHNMNQMSSRPQNMYNFQTTTTTSNNPGSLVVDVDEPELLNKPPQGMGFGQAQMMNPLMQSMVQNAGGFSQVSMQQTRNLMGNFPQQFGGLPNFMMPEDGQVTMNPTKPQSHTPVMRSSPQEFSPATKEVVYIDSPQDILSASTSPSTFASDPKAADKETSMPLYSDFKPLSAEEVFQVQKHAFNKLP